MFLSKRSWTKSFDESLLTHETGHYLIGAICALEFMKRCHITYFSEDYEVEVRNIFKDTLKHFIDFEIQYDEQTNHMKNVEVQLLWNQKLKQLLNDYTLFFK